MQAQKKFKVECLLEKEAFDFFCKKVGDMTLKSHPEILGLAWEMTKECKGLPLAIITVGSAMAGVRIVEAWRQAKNDLRSSPWIASSLEDEVFRIVKFSYDRLPDEAHKNCFLYCALYPEDYEVDVNPLIDRWIGEGFLSGNKTKKSIYDMYEQGESIIEKLKLSCLLEGVEDEYGFRPAIKMHDVTRDMALWIARDQDVNKGKVVVQQGEALSMSEMDVDRLNMVERISIIGANISWDWQIPTCPNLITLCIQGYGYTTVFSNLLFMTRLKLLDLSGKSFEHLPVEIGNLIELEFLNLSETGIRNRFPIELKNLKNLRIFLMEDCPHNLEIIPLEVIESLWQLKVFRFTSGNYNKTGEFFEEAFLQKLESLPKLEELGMTINTFTGMHKLIGSTKLQGCWRHFSSFRMEDPLEMSPLLASMSRMKNLYSISLSSINIIAGSSITDTCYLQKLRLDSCDSITHLTWLIYAPLLEFLVVRYCNSIEELVNEAQDDTFQNLRVLRLYCLPKLRSIHRNALDFPYLAYILVDECPNLKKLPLNSNSAKDLIAIEGEEEWWNNLEWQDTDTDIKELLHSKFREA